MFIRRLAFTCLALSLVGCQSMATGYRNINYEKMDLAIEREANRHEEQMREIKIQVREIKVISAPDSSGVVYKEFPY
jgi:hypothetical protein